MTVYIIVNFIRHSAHAHPRKCIGSEMDDIASLFFYLSEVSVVLELRIVMWLHIHQGRGPQPPGHGQVPVHGPGVGDLLGYGTQICPGLYILNVLFKSHYISTVAQKSIYYYY